MPSDGQRSGARIAGRLKERFISELRIEKYREELLSTRQADTESVRDFVERFQRLVRIVKDTNSQVPDQIVIQRLINGLNQKTQGQFKLQRMAYWDSQSVEAVADYAIHLEDSGFALDVTVDLKKPVPKKGVMVMATGQNEDEAGPSQIAAVGGVPGDADGHADDNASNVVSMDAISLWRSWIWFCCTWSC
jgi:hypothetical protein